MRTGNRKKNKPKTPSFRNKKYVSKKTDDNKRVVETKNGQFIYDLMVERKIKGKYKDHVILMDDLLIDWLDSYGMKYTRDNDIVVKATINGIALIHKSKLCFVLGKEIGEKFWKNGMRTNVGVEKRRKNCIKVKK